MEIDFSDAGATIDVVVPEHTEQHVGADLPINLVVAVVALQRIGAVVAGENIAKARAEDVFDPEQPIRAAAEAGEAADQVEGYTGRGVVECAEVEPEKSASKSADRTERTRSARR